MADRRAVMVNNINKMGEGEGRDWREVVVAGGREEGENTQWGGVGVEADGVSQRLMRGQGEKRAKDPKRNNGRGLCLSGAQSRNRVRAQPYRYHY